MKFGNPLALIYALWLIPLIVLFWLAVIRRRKYLVAKFINKPLWPAMVNSLDTHRVYLKIFLVFLSIVLVFIALTGPQIGFKWQEVKRKGLDIIFVVDVSKSMLADDISPSRLERSKLAIRDIVRRLRGDRVGLVAFAGEAFLQCPLTLDYDGFLLSLKDLDVNTISRGSTSVSKALKKAIGSYDPGIKRYRVLVIISDGEEHEGDAINMAKEAKREKVKIFCVGVGSKNGSLIPYVDKKGQKVFLRDEKGNRVKSRLNEKLLKEIAFITGGAYVHATKTDFGINTIYREKISSLQKREVTGKKTKIYHERFQIPLLLAILLLCIEAVISKRKRQE